MKIILTLNFAEYKEQTQQPTNNNDTKVETTSGNNDNQENPRELISKGGGIKLDKDFYDKVDSINEETDSTVSEENEEGFEDVEHKKVYLGDFWKEYYGKDSDRIAKDVLNARIGSIIESNWASDDLKSQANAIKRNVEQGKQDVYGALATVPILNKNEQVPSEYQVQANRYIKSQLSNEYLEPEVKKHKLRGNILKFRHPEYNSRYDPSNHTIYLRSGGEPVGDNDQSNFYSGFIDPKSDKVNIINPPEGSVLAHEYSHALNPAGGPRFENTKMYLADGGDEQLGEMGSFKRAAFKQGLGEIKTPENFKNVLRQIKVDKDGVGYWQNGEKVDTETQRFLNTGRQLDWDFVLQMMQEDPDIWEKVGKNSRSVNQLLRRNYSNFPQTERMRTV